MIRLLFMAVAEGAPDNPGNGDELRHGDVEYTRTDFMEMSLSDIEELTGVIRPKSQTTDTVQQYRETAWRSYRQDVSNRDEWGNARQDNIEPVDPENEGFDEPDINLDNVIAEELRGEDDRID